jgi:AraC family transcriptional activator of pobA
MLRNPPVAVILGGMETLETPARRRVPRYVLYGEAEYGTPSRAADPGFLHIEKLSARSAMYGWEIAPHCHPGLVQLFWVESGGGEARLDHDRVAFTGPALIVVPPPLVHGFSWEPQSEGLVLTLAAEFVAGLAHGAGDAVGHALDKGRVLSLTKEQAAAHEIGVVLHGIAHELRYGALGMTAAVAARLQLLMVAIVRLAPAPVAASPGADIWQRFRDSVEARFRHDHAVSDIAASIAITRGRLDAVCRRHAGRTAQQVVHDRLVLEAQRSLLFTGLTVAEIAYDLGFADPAYFSRFFAREAGEAPGEYRRRHRG